MQVGKSLGIVRRELPGWSNLTGVRTRHMVRKGADGQQELVVGGNAGYKVRQQQQRAHHPCTACQGQPLPGDTHDGRTRGRDKGLCAWWQYDCVLLQLCLQIQLLTTDASLMPSGNVSLTLIISTQHVSSNSELQRFGSNNATHGERRGTSASMPGSKRACKTNNERKPDTILVASSHAYF